VSAAAVLSGWSPSQHTVVLVGAAIAAVLVTSAAIVERDAWIRRLRAHRNAVKRGAFAAVVVLLGAFALAHHDAVDHLLARVERGDHEWLAVAVGLETVSFAGYVVLTYVIHRPFAPRLDWPTSAELTLAGVVATRVLSAGGAGGIAFTGWVLHRAGMSASVAARRLTAFMILLYSLYVGALLLGGLLVVTGILTGVPRLLGAAALLVGGVVTGAALALMRVPDDLEHRARALAQRPGRIAHLAARLAPVPQAAGEAARLALSIARERPSVLLWPATWWAFDIATLWATFHAFGEPPALGTLVLCYFLGQMGNLLPLPGGVGGTEGGMVGAFAASGVGAGVALLAVVSYQAISTYLPGIPGLASYVDLRRRMRAWGDEATGADAPSAAPAGEGASEQHRPTDVPESERTRTSKP
jgi:uncharacterized protein (TIRG00374 family)